MKTMSFGTVRSGDIVVLLVSYLTLEREKMERYFYGASVTCNLLG